MRVWVGFVLVSVLLAGCIGGPAARSEDQDWPTINDPKNLSYDTDSGFHVHDYWGGRTQITVLDQTYRPTFHNCGDESTSWTTRYHPRDGQMIPQGTESLTVTVTWEERDPVHTSKSCNPALNGFDNSYGDMELWVKPADASKLRLVEDDLTSGEPVQVPLEYEEADLPHQVVSAWDFEVRIRGSDNPDYNHFEGSITIEGDAHRGLELRPFPPHPDHWGNRTEFTLVNHSDSFYRQYNVVCPPRCGWSGNQLTYVRPPNGTIVPLQTQRVDVTLTYDNEAPVGDLHLYHHAADSREFQRLEPDEAGDGEKRYVIPVNETMADTPYANASQWAFYVNAPQDWTQEPAMFDGEYTLDATVHKG